MTGKHYRETEEQERVAGVDPHQGAGEEQLAEPVVVRDRRKIDPETGQVRQQAEAEEVPEVPVASVPADVGTQSDIETQLAERTTDLQRLQAEYANYRKRVDRDRETVINNAKASVVADLLPLLDDLERAEQHGDLTGAFKAVADKLVAGMQRAGLTPFGTEGEPFDPSVHEAVQHSTSPDVPGPTVTTVLRRGYSFGDRVLRAALVGVTDHEPAPVDSPMEGELPVEQLSNENNQQ